MNAFVKDLIDQVLGESLTPVTLVATYIFATIGLFIRWYFDTRKGVKKNLDTPRKFSMPYWLKNNLWHKVVSVFAVYSVIFVLVRFPADWGLEYVGYFGALIIGVAFDYFVDSIKKKVDSLKHAK